MAEQQQISPNDELMDTVGRIRSLEGKYNLLRDKVLIINNNMIEEYKKSITETKSLNEEIKEIKKDIFKIKESMKHLLNELELFARKEDVKFLEKYINLWNPLKFTTENDVKRLIQESLEEHQETKEKKSEIYGRKE
ncbi:hypothetical protein J4476_00190 [Candidatus Woesearchaeota archaeon]|nr:MAG: hypothetical protein QT09_C0010G0010 [archaeon GW2011_AR18]MBS3161103.1 hypothetical protein [Candidatus Woesearchaeota archaeon]HIH25511.1 DUF342 domain-containing protein [Nanoarchaeota archaeon]